MSHGLVIVALEQAVSLSADELAKAVGYQMDPFDEEDKWFKDGSRWDYWTIGGRYEGALLGKNAARRVELTEEACHEASLERSRKLWKAWERELHKDEVTQHFLYGLDGVDSLESLLDRTARESPIIAYAFLRNRVWHEKARLGFFGMTAATECEITAENKGMEYAGRCLVTCKETDAKIVSFDEDRNDRWQELYYARFIRPLAPDTMLVAVDYHV